MKDAQGFTPIHPADQPDDGHPVHPDDLPKQSAHNGYDPQRDANPGLFFKLFRSAESKQAQAVRLQREAELETERVARLQSELRNLEATRQRGEDELAELDARHEQFVAGRATYLETHRANWRKGQYLGLGMAEIDFIIADYPAHRAVLVERLEAAQAAIAAFQRKHKI